MQTAPQTQALILLFKTMPPQTQKEFKEWISDHATEEEDKKFWLNANADAIEQIWNDPEEDIWDEIYKKHKEDGTNSLILFGHNSHYPTKWTNLKYAQP
jgi:hypothetical protein